MRKYRDENKKGKKREGTTKKTTIPFNFYIVFFGVRPDFFNTTFINADIYRVINIA